MNEGTRVVVLDKLRKPIEVGDKVIVTGGQGALQRMIVEGFGGRNNIKCRPTDEDSCAKVKKLFHKTARECIVIEKGFVDHADITPVLEEAFGINGEQSFYLFEELQEMGAFKECRNHIEQIGKLFNPFYVKFIKEWEGK